ncbi:unnamed protein product [Rotaria sordida]|uniref:Uncharacterized protein n=1 Tax=Rotaria sordida TaxID=392033 RepID=A0A813VQQ7_9BILA|nr:unnamed protein product [Rotaria sordida]
MSSGEVAEEKLKITLDPTTVNINSTHEQPISANSRIINTTTNEIDKEPREESSPVDHERIDEYRSALGTDELQSQFNGLNRDIDEFDQSERPTDRLVKTNDERRHSDPNQMNMNQQEWLTPIGQSRAEQTEIERSELLAFQTTIPQDNRQSLSETFENESKTSLEPYESSTEVRTINLEQPIPAASEQTVLMPNVQAKATARIQPMKSSEEMPQSMGVTTEQNLTKQASISVKINIHVTTTDINNDSLSSSQKFPSTTVVGVASLSSESTEISDHYSTSSNETDDADSEKIDPMHRHKSRKRTISKDKSVDPTPTGKEQDASCTTDRLDSDQQDETSAQQFKEDDGELLDARKSSST